MTDINKLIEETKGMAETIKALSPENKQRLEGFIQGMKIAQDMKKPA